MVYKRYIKRNGKLYGPYYYESKRIGGKVVAVYKKAPESEGMKEFAAPKGVPENGKPRRFPYLISTLLIITGIVVLSKLFIVDGVMTGRISRDIASISAGLGKVVLSLIGAALLSFIVIYIIYSIHRMRVSYFVDVKQEDSIEKSGKGMLSLLLERFNQIQTSVKRQFGREASDQKREFEQAPSNVLDQFGEGGKKNVAWKLEKLKDLDSESVKKRREKIGNVLDKVLDFENESVKELESTVHKITKYIPEPSSNSKEKQALLDRIEKLNAKNKRKC